METNPCHYSEVGSPVVFMIPEVGPKQVFVEFPALLVVGTGGRRKRRRGVKRLVGD